MSEPLKFKIAPSPSKLAEFAKANSKFVERWGKNLRIALDMSRLLVINEAKSTGPFIDRTGNLRNSIGSAGVDIPASDDSESIRQASPEEAIKKIGETTVCTINVGMEYGAAVEVKKPYMEPAIAAIEAEVESLIDQAFTLSKQQAGL